jgi:hypothetical protein
MKKWAYELNREFLKEEVQMANKYRKKCSTLKGCKSKQHEDFISPQLEWPSSRAKTTNAGRDSMKQEPLYTVGRNEN